MVKRSVSEIPEMTNIEQAIRAGQPESIRSLCIPASGQCYSPARIRRSTPVLFPALSIITISHMFHFPWFPTTQAPFGSFVRPWNRDASQTNLL